MAGPNEVALVNKDSIELVKRVVKCMAINPSGFDMAKGAITVLDSLELWNNGEIETEQSAKADMALIEWFAHYLFSLAKRRGVDISIDTSIRNDSAYVDIGDYDLDLKSWGESWSYRPMGKGEGEERTAEWQNNINPERIKCFTEPPTENCPATTDQSTTGQ